jgi:hypothetical protein
MEDIKKLRGEWVNIMNASLKKKFTLKSIIFITRGRSKRRPAV